MNRRENRDDLELTVIVFERPRCQRGCPCPDCMIGRLEAAIGTLETEDRRRGERRKALRNPSN